MSVSNPSALKKKKKKNTIASKGFQPDVAYRALDATNWSLQRAVEWVLQHEPDANIGTPREESSAPASQPAVPAPPSAPADLLSFDDEPAQKPNAPAVAAAAPPPPAWAGDDDFADFGAFSSALPDAAAPVATPPASVPTTAPAPEPAAASASGDAKPPISLAALYAQGAKSPVQSKPARHLAPAPAAPPAATLASPARPPGSSTSGGDLSSLSALYAQSRSVPRAAPAAVAPMGLVQTEQQAGAGNGPGGALPAASVAPAGGFAAASLVGAGVTPRAARTAESGAGLAFGAPQNVAQVQASSLPTPEVSAIAPTQPPLSQPAVVSVQKNMNDVVEKSVGKDEEPNGSVPKLENLTEQKREEAPKPEESASPPPPAEPAEPEEAEDPFASLASFALSTSRNASAAKGAKPAPAPAVHAKTAAADASLVSADAQTSPALVPATGAGAGAGGGGISLEDLLG